MPNMVLDRLAAERDRVSEQIDEILAGVEADERDPSESERSLIARQRGRLDELEPQIVELVELEERRHASRDVSAMLQRGGARGAGRGAGVERSGDSTPHGAEPDPIYRTFAEYARDQLIVRYDQIAQRVGSGAREGALERLQRAVANTTSTSVAGLVPPQYMTEIMTVIDKSRPIVDTSRRVPLTSGTLQYPSITQKPIVGKQTAEKTEGPSAMNVAFVSVTADTYTGVGDLSWQAMNWSTPDALQLWFDLAAEAYAVQTEAAAGLVLAAVTAQATPAVPASPVLADWISAIMAAAAAIYAASHRHADTVYADIASGYGIMGQVANVAPVFFPAGNFNISTGQGNVGGLRLVISPGLPAKTVVVAASGSLLCAESAGSPVELRAVEPALGGMQVGVIGAFACKLTDAGAARKLTVT
jgi:HK97 family phage major capsid protein